MDAISPQRRLLGEEVDQQLREIGEVDLLIGIPSYNNAGTIEHVVRAVKSGLAKYFPGRRALLVNSDGGSHDGTPELARQASIDDYRTLLTAYPLQPVHKIVTPYHGLPGKGSALRTVFLIAAEVKARACAVIDADLRSITPQWIEWLLGPILHEGFDYVTPLYRRHKYDGTITNHIVYPLTRALYGCRVRQPIGGDFGFSGQLASHYLTHDVWHTNVARMIQNCRTGIHELHSLWERLVSVNVGWALAHLLKVIIRRALIAARFDRFCENSGLGQLFRRADILSSPSELSARGVFWMIWLVFMMSAAGALGLDPLSRLVGGFFTYLPNIFAAFMLLVIGMLLANFLARAAVLAMVNEGLASAHLVGNGVRILTAILAFAMALDQLQIARNIVTTGFAIAFGPIMFGAALAFGLGGRDLARHILEERFLNQSKKDQDRFLHL